MSHRTAIEVRGARTHNLKNIDCEIPHRRLTVVTGPSGAGKSSLAFDTIYAEAQRRYVESVSTYARQFLDQMERPPVDSVVGIMPAVALEAKNSVRNARSTVGTLTEVHDVLRLLFTHLGRVECPRGHGAVASHTSQQVAEELAAGVVGDRFMLLAAIERPVPKADLKLRELVRQGFFRRLGDAGQIVRMKPSERWKKALDPLLLVLGRFRADGQSGARLAAAVEEIYRLTGGKLRALGEDGELRYFGRRLSCGKCGESLERPTPALFSFNSPLGACAECQGFGRVMGIDPERVIPDPSRTLAERPIAPWDSPSFEDRYERLYTACSERGVPLDVPYSQLSEATRRWIWSGSGPFTNLDKFFAWLERRIYKMHVRVMLSRYRAYDTCPSCAGRRLQPAALAVRWMGATLPWLTALSVKDLGGWLAEQRFSRAQPAAAGHLLESLTERLETLRRVGLDYLTLDRQARTLSGGETQRIQLAAALGSGLTSTLYVLDEPTIGLHPRDSSRLLELLRDLSRRGNTVLVVEHDRTLITGADHVIDLGPRAGEHGGQVVAAGTVKEIRQADSLTGEWLRQRAPGPKRSASQIERDARLAELPRLEIRGASANNLRNIDVELPLGALVVVTGVSGSGKSTLVENVLHGTYQRSRGVVDVDPGACRELLGLDELADVTLVDQRPLGRSSRSNPVTYIKAYDVIRKLYADTAVARQRGIQPGDFSFNLDRGRCTECQGTGVTEVDMQFMAPVTVVCDSCQGRRFQAHILTVTFQGRNIHETLELTVERALEEFAGERRLCRRLESLRAVGLGYLRLGQPTSTLSGGEAQRLKLASFLDRPKKGSRRLFLFDEPTTGLHVSDIELLTSTLRQLVDRGDGVVVVEHSTDLMARADWIVDLGPGGGPGGGELLYSGPIIPFLDRVESPTAEELRRHLRWRRKDAEG